LGECVFTVIPKLDQPGITELHQKIGTAWRTLHANQSLSNPKFIPQTDAFGSDGSDLGSVGSELSDGVSDGLLAA
jgi:hypothetical protein